MHGRAVFFIGTTKSFFFCRYYSDGIHLNSSGFRKLVKNWEQVIKKMIRTPDGKVLSRCEILQRERGHWAVYYTSPQSFMIKFAYSLAQQLWGI